MISLNKVFDTRNQLPKPAEMRLPLLTLGKRVNQQFRRVYRMTRWPMIHNLLKKRDGIQPDGIHFRRQVRCLLSISPLICISSPSRFADLEDNSLFSLLGVLDDIEMPDAVSSCDISNGSVIETCGFKANTHHEMSMRDTCGDGTNSIVSLQAPKITSYQSSELIDRMSMNSIEAEQMNESEEGTCG